MAPKLTDQQNVICRPYLRDFVYEQHLKNGTELECPICLETITCKHCFLILSCGHHSHSFCMHRVNRCPICRN